MGDRKKRGMRRRGEEKEKEKDRQRQQPSLEKPVQP